ncbi:MAG: hypothetical protein Q8900_08080 [Bacillota bacterium]|nr:hypothetical protein [Bacillota bacterium]
MNDYLFYFDFYTNITIPILLIIGLILYCIYVKLNKKCTLFNFAKIIGVAILSIVVIFRFSIPSIKDYNNFKHNNFSVIEGTVTEKIHGTKDPTYHVIINNKQMEVSYYDYCNIIINKNYKIGYLPYTQIAIEVYAE